MTPTDDRKMTGAARRLRVHVQIAKSLPPRNTETQRYGVALDWVADRDERVAALTAERDALTAAIDEVCPAIENGLMTIEQVYTVLRNAIEATVGTPDQREATTDATD